MKIKIKNLALIIGAKFIEPHWIPNWEMVMTNYNSRAVISSTDNYFK